MQSSVQLITEFVERPTFLAGCSKSCANFAQMPCDPDLDTTANLKNFLALGAAEGWIISLLGNLCPRHAQQCKTPSILIPVNGFKH